jgi:acetyl-CoA acetyltransferase
VTRLTDMRAVSVVGAGLHRYQRGSDTSFVTLGTTAVREALGDAGLAWPSVQSAYVATSLLGMATGREVVRFLGATGLSVTQVENASASGSAAFRQAVLDVASGLHDVVIAIGIDKPVPGRIASQHTGVPALLDELVAPFTHFALLMQAYMTRTGATREQIAAVAVKNHANGALNPYAQRRQARTLEEVLAPPQISGQLTRLQCTSIGEGAAAVIVAADSVLDPLGLERRRCVRIRASAAQSEVVNPTENVDVALTRTTTREAFEQAGVGPADLDVIEVHDAFSIEEILYAEAMGLSAEGQAPHDIASGKFSINGRAALSPSGGLLAMGHPIGPTGLGQIVEVARQLRGEAGARQHDRAHLGLVHMVGLGAVCLVHLLESGARHVSTRPPATRPPGAGTPGGPGLNVTGPSEPAGD